MAKTIVFCNDGTSNGAEVGGSDTNVLKLYRLLEGTNNGPANAPEQERQLGTEDNVTQVAKYIHGVGDSENLLAKLAGDSLGVGMVSRVVRGYTFISRNYQPGDKIVLVGFSRGAYGVRALAGMIDAFGLLDYSKGAYASKPDAYQAGIKAWLDYCNTIRTKEGVGAAILGRAEEITLKLMLPSTVDYVAGVNIAAVAVWDTVGALGVPVYHDGQRVDEFCFAATKRPPCVQNAFHAVSVDEQREDFTPTLFDKDDQVVQVLFPGAHSDVGGGYPLTGGESGLSDIALQWMIDNLHGIALFHPISDSNDFVPNPLGPAHEPWRKPPFNFMPTALRKFPQPPPQQQQQQQLTVHEAVLERWNKMVKDDPAIATESPYRPHNIENSYVTPAGQPI
jgi:glutathione S-transferase